MQSFYPVDIPTEQFKVLNVFVEVKISSDISGFLKKWIDADSIYAFSRGLKVPKSWPLPWPLHKKTLNSMRKEGFLRSGRD